MKILLYIAMILAFTVCCSPDEELSSYTQTTRSVNQVDSTSDGITITVDTTWSDTIVYNPDN